MDQYHSAEQEKQMHFPHSQSREPAAYPSPPTYDPSTYAHPPNGQSGTLVLYDVENGDQVGTLGEQIYVSGVAPGSQEPVEIDLSRADGVVTIRPLQPDYLHTAEHPAYANSRLVGTAATASRLLVTGAQYVAKAVDTGAKTFTEKTQPVPKPMTFEPSTHNRVRQIHNYTVTGAKISAETIGKVQNVAQNFGAKLAGKSGHEPPAKPGLLNKTLISISTIGDAIDHASKLILTTSSQAATIIVGHRYGPEAGELAQGLTGTVKNVGLIYVDASGVSRRAVVKSVAKGMVVGKVKGGGEVIFQGDNTSTGEYTTQGPLPPYEKNNYASIPPLKHANSFPITTTQHHGQPHWTGAATNPGTPLSSYGGQPFIANSGNIPAPGHQRQYPKEKQPYNPADYRY